MVFLGPGIAATPQVVATERGGGSVRVVDERTPGVRFVIRTDQEVWRDTLVKAIGM